MTQTQKIITAEDLKRGQFAFAPKNRQECFALQKKLLDMGCLWESGKDYIQADYTFSAIFVTEGRISGLEEGTLWDQKTTHDAKAFIEQPYPKISTLKDVTGTLLFHPETDEEAKLMQLRLFAMGACWKGHSKNKINPDFHSGNTTLFLMNDFMVWTNDTTWDGTLCNVRQLPRTPEEIKQQRDIALSVFKNGLDKEKQKHPAIRLKNPRP